MCDAETTAKGGRVLEVQAARAACGGVPARARRPGAATHPSPGVPTGDGKLWKDQLRARGVKDKHPLMGGAGRLADRPPGTLVPPRALPPKVPIYEGPLPWGELAEQAA
jgi:hypothetical protein